MSVIRMSVDTEEHLEKYKIILPPPGLSRTYTTNSLVPDSAATAFSMYSGVKTNFYTMGYDSNIQVTGAKHCAFPAILHVITVPRV